MSPLEDEIRDTLRSEAARLREVRPLHLPAAVALLEPRAVPRPHGVRRLRGWLGPAVAAAVMVLVAATLVTLKSLGNGLAPVPAASPSPIAGPALAADATPRYYVRFGPELGAAGRSAGPAIIVGDEKAGKTIAAFPVLAKGRNYRNYSVTDVAVTGAADDRTFVVSASVRATGSSYAAGQVALPLTWYLVRILPGSADPVLVTKLPVKFPASPTASAPGGQEVLTTALSGDGTELAVLSAKTGVSWTAGEPLTLQVYSVVTGLLQHSWSASIKENQADRKPITDLSWVGDNTLGFAVTYTPEVREEVRTLDVTASGASLLAGSRLVWSQDVPPSAKLTPAEKASIAVINPPPHACDTPFLTGNGQAVVCGNSTLSANGKRLSAVWLAYPLATPARPRVLGRVQEPAGVTAFDGSIGVDWTNPSGTEIIATWNPLVTTGPSSNPVTSVSNDEAYIGNGTVTTFPYILGSGGGLDIAW